MSTYFLLDPFEFLYYFYRIRGELIYVLSIVVCIPSTFCPTLGHHRGRIYYKRDVNFVLAYYYYVRASLPLNIMAFAFKWVSNRINFQTSTLALVWKLILLSVGCICSFCLLFWCSNIVVLSVRIFRDCAIGHECFFRCWAIELVSERCIVSLLDRVVEIKPTYILLLSSEIQSPKGHLNLYITLVFCKTPIEGEELFIMTKFEVLNLL